MTPWSVQARRDREFAEARSAAEIEALQQRWQAEDAALAEAGSPTALEIRQLREENAELRRRIARVERNLLSKDGSGLSETLINGIAMAMAELQKDMRREIDRRGLLTYGGVWDVERSYKASHVVSHNGAAWVAIADCAKGEKPGRGVGWKLFVKATAEKGYTMA